ncbi:MAG: aminotransferase class IV, partial [Bacteroidales bacterium]|nr:aminotransferase class IV [Bacteroidales bacterium]
MAEIDYSKRSFNYYPTNAIVFSKCIDGRWSKPEVTNDFNFSVHCFGGVFHYAPSCFEGLKAYRGVDGRVRMFRPDENAKRMASSAQYLDMPSPTMEMFLDMCILCVQENWDYIPPYESGASLYLRPVLFGINPQLGIHSSKDVMFAVMASAVGTYSGAKALVPGTAVLSRNYDRAATYGSGGYKLGANYAQSLHAYNLAHRMGYRELLFLDSATHTHIEEFGSSNF